MNKSIFFNRSVKMKQQIQTVSIGLIFGISLMLTLTSCETEEAQLAFNDIPVVESYLIQTKPVSVKLSRKTPYDFNVALSDENLDLLQVKILYNDQIRLIPSVGKGEYKDATFFPQEGVKYKLEFKFNNQTVSSSTEILSKPVNYKQSVTTIKMLGIDFSTRPPTRPEMPDPVKLSWANNDNSYYMVVIENTETAPLAINDYGDREPPGRFFRNAPTQTNQYEIQAMRFQYYGKHRLILYHLNADYAALYNDTGNSSQNLTNPATNIENGLGIFTGINADTLFLNVLRP
ncbi:MAG: DUF4249 family protein [Bacteroidota bacterium]|nr:hypothetical protein [Odoribacter sp.]MDP3645135.1 DUF4249 family protein [Bacteroidota bacterium]